MATEPDTLSPVLPPPPPPPPARWLRWALIVSLTVNLLLVGLAVGAAYNVKSSGGPPRSYDLSLGPLGRALDGEARRDLAMTLRRSGAVRPLDRVAGAAMLRDMAEVLVATPFDPAALSALLDQQRRDWTGVQEAAQAALVAYITELSPEARAAFAARLTEQGRSRGGDGDGQRGDDRPH